MMNTAKRYVAATTLFVILAPSCIQSLSLSSSTTTTTTTTAYDSCKANDGEIRQRTECSVLDTSTNESTSTGSVSSSSLHDSETDFSKHSAEEMMMISFTNSILEPILAEDYETIDPEVVPNCIRALKARGAHRCWHKHSTFLDHLLSVHNILRLWGQGHVIGRVGLFHSAYSNSYVNLALYDPTTERTTMQQLIGKPAENLVHLFCIINRQDVVVNTLLRQGFIPRDGLYVPHLRNPTTEQVYLSPETLRMLLVFTMADIADQYFGWQDELFGGGGEDGSMIIPGQDTIERHNTQATWPGISKPGLWMSYVSSLAQVARTFDRTWTDSNDTATTTTTTTFADQTLDVPPVFASGTQTLSVTDEAAARDLYWSVVMGDCTDDDNVIPTLQACCSKNPWTFEPLVLLAQHYLYRNDYAAAVDATKRALALQEQWGTAYDKRLSFSAWVAWTRVLYQRAIAQQPWPTNSWDVNNFGLVH